MPQTTPIAWLGPGDRAPSNSVLCIVCPMVDRRAVCSREGCGKELSQVHDAKGIDAEGHVGLLWTCKTHRTELWMKRGDELVAPLEWWPDQRVQRRPQPL
jgi:hypothetical protein